MIAHLLRVSSLFAEVETPKRTVRAAAPKKGAVILNINIINISFFLIDYKRRGFYTSVGFLQFCYTFAYAVFYVY